jgi:uncharacterized membrane protein YeaQ/YmgE (transglycosylase-associated protein family)
MDQAYGALGQPGVGFFTMIVIGAIAGWIAERVTESNHGIFTNILVGLAGSFIGTRLADVLNVPVHGFLRILVAATVGAIIILLLWNAWRGRGRAAPH